MDKDAPKSPDQDKAPEQAQGGLVGFWQELKRRKVVRVAIVYAVVAWLLAQVAITVFPHVGLPDWAPTLIIWILIIGFPIALIFAWAFQLTAEGIKVDFEIRAGGSVTDAKGHKLNYITLGLVVLVLTFLVVDRYLFNAPRTKVTPSSVPTQGGQATVAGTIQLPDAATLASGVASLGIDSPLVALSPDSSWLVYVGRDDNSSRLYRRRLNGFDDPEPISGTEGAIHAFFSPNGQSIGFLTDDRLKRLSIEGDDLRTIATTNSAFRSYWTEDEWIYFADGEGTVLQRVPASGGEVEIVFNSPVESSLWMKFSDVLPDGRYALATQKHVSMSGDYAIILLFDLRTGEYKPLGISGYDARWIPTDYLVFGRSGNVMAIRFDQERGVILGDPVSIIHDVAMDSVGDNMQLAVSTEGTLAYVPGTNRGIGNIFAIDRQGIERQLPGTLPQRYGTLDVSKDDKSIAIHVADVRDYVWVYDLERQEGRKLAGSDDYGWPSWHPLWRRGQRRTVLEIFLLKNPV